MDGDDVCTIHDGVEALESTLGGVGQPEDETDEKPPVSFQQRELSGSEYGGLSPITRRPLPEPTTDG